jgi:Ca2+-transporting ATPase
MIIAVAAGRRIYSILKSNTLYRFHSYSIILTVVLPLFWLDLPDIFTPVHVIFLELVGPMCSIVYENEPAEKKML